MAKPKSTLESTTSTDPSIEAVHAPEPPTHAIVEQWWVETFCNIGLDTQLYNRFRAAADRLKALIAATR